MKVQSHMKAMAYILLWIMVIGITGYLFFTLDYKLAVEMESLGPNFFHWKLVDSPRHHPNDCVLSRMFMIPTMLILLCGVGISFKLWIIDALIPHLWRQWKTFVRSME